MNAVQHISYTKNFMDALKRIRPNPNDIEPVTLLPKIKNDDGSFTWSNEIVSDLPLTMQEYVEYRKFAGKNAMGFEELRKSGIRQATTCDGTTVWSQKRDIVQEIKIMVKKWFK